MLDERGGIGRCLLYICTYGMSGICVVYDCWVDCNILSFLLYFPRIVFITNT